MVVLIIYHFKDTGKPELTRNSSLSIMDLPSKQQLEITREGHQQSNHNPMLPYVVEH